jgi:uncharacterized repeat protein (TIGR01451 family)
MRRLARVEFLEDRRVLAVLTVNSLGDNPADTSALTLRDALTLVNNAGSPGSLGQASMPSGWASQIAGNFGSNDTIQFEPSLFGSTQQSITLTGGALDLIANVSIAGPGADKLAIDAPDFFWDSPLRNISANSEISGLSISQLDNLGGMAITNAELTGNGFHNYGTATITDSTVSATDDFENFGSMSITDSAIATNWGIRVNAYAHMMINNSAITQSTYSYGIVVAQDAQLTLVETTVSGSALVGIGNDGGNVALTDCTVSHNGWNGIENSSGDVALIGTTVAGNGWDGISNAGTAEITNSTVTGNGTAGDTLFHDGISNSGTVQLSDSTVSGNSFCNVINSGTVLATNSIIAGNAVANLQNTGTFNDLGGNLLDGDPMLGPLASNGGPTQTMLPLPGSPAIDAGAAALLAPGTITDQRGYARTAGAGLDSGAVESSASAPADADLAVAVQAPATVDWGGQLTFTLTVTNLGPADQSHVSLTDLLPDNTTFVSWQPSPANGSTWSVTAPPVGGAGAVTAWTSSLPSGGSATFSLSVQHDTAPSTRNLFAFSVVNVVTVAPLTGDAHVDNNSTQVVTPLADIPTTTYLTQLSQASSVVGEPVMFEADVRGVVQPHGGDPGDPLTYAPSGLVTFYDGAAQIGTVALKASSDGIADFTVRLPTVGPHSITAAYTSGDATFAPSALSAPVTQVVNQADTLTTVTSTAARSTAAFGQNVAFTANVSVATPGAGAPTGTVQFQVDGQNLGNPVPLDSNDQASISSSAIPIGNHRVTADYSGDSNFLTSTGLLPGTISTFAGNGTGLYTLPSPANAAVLNNPLGVAVDPAGDVFIADAGSSSIRKVDANTGVISAVDNAPFSQNFYYNYPGNLVGMVCDASGDLYYSDPGSNVVEKVSPSGVVTTVAGTFSNYGGYSGDGGLATAAQLRSPSGLALDSAGDLFIVDEGNGVVREVTPAGIISTVAGGGSPAYPSIGDGGPATAASFFAPTGIAVNAAGDLFIADTGNQAIRKVDHATGIISTLLNLSNTGYSTPQGLVLDAAGDLFIADSTNYDIAELSAAGALTTFAGTSGSGGYNGDGGPAAAALLNAPTALATDAAGDLFIADTVDQVIREVNSAGTINTVAGGGILGALGNGGPATNVPLQNGNDIAVDAAGDLFIASTGENVVREVTPDGIIHAVAGTGTAGYSGDGGLATSAQLNSPDGLAIDAAGDLFIADGANNVIRMVTPAGVITTVAGNGIAGYSGDGGPATSASLHLTPYAGFFITPLTIDASGDLFIADGVNGVLREVSAAGIISTVTLPATFAYGSNSLSTAAYFGSGTGAGLVEGLAVDANGDLFISNGGRGVVLELSKAGVLSVVAGDLVGFPGHIADSGPALGAEMGSVGGLAFDAAGDLLIADAIFNSNGVIRSVSPAGIVSTIAGAPVFDSNGNFISYAGNGDGGLATSAPLYPNGMAVDAAGDLFIAENNDIRKISPSLVVTKDSTTTAVMSNTSSPVYGQALTLTFSVASVIPGVGTPSGTVQLEVDGQDFGSPLTLAANGTASLTTSALPVGIHTITAVYSGSAQFQASTGVLASGTIETVIGTGVPGYSGDGGPAISAQLNQLPEGLAFDSAGNLYIADLYNQVIRKVSTDGTITTVAGNGTVGYSGDGGLATAAQLNYPFDVAIDSLGDLFIDDCVNNVIREVFPNGIITTVAGNGTGGYSGDGGPATAAELYRPGAIAVDQFGDLFIADSLNHVVREVTPDGIIHTVAGNGTAGNSGDGGAATAAAMYSPDGLAVDSAGDLFISDFWENVIREVTPDGIIHTIAGNGVGGGTGGGGYSGDGGPATAAELFNPEFIRLDAAGDLFISDGGNNVIREVRAGIITTVAGNGTAGYTGDGGPATAAELGAYPAGLAVDAYGDLFIADATNNVIREVTPTLYVSPDSSTTTVASSDSTSVVGQSVTFTATVVAAAPGSGTPTGTVTFWDGTTELGTGTLDANGQATFTTSGLSLGTHTITVSYSGSADFKVSVSLAISQTVLSSQQEAGVMVNQVNALVASGILHKGEGHELVSSLDHAIAMLNRGHTKAGVEQLNDFIHQVQALVKGHKLDATDAQTLINSANLAIAGASLK